MFCLKTLSWILPNSSLFFTLTRGEVTMFLLFSKTYNHSSHPNVSHITASRKHNTGRSKSKTKPEAMARTILPLPSSLLSPSSNKSFLSIHYENTHPPFLLSDFSVKLVTLVSVVLKKKVLTWWVLQLFIISIYLFII